MTSGGPSFSVGERPLRFVRDNSSDLVVPCQNVSSLSSSLVCSPHCLSPGRKTVCAQVDRRRKRKREWEAVLARHAQRGRARQGREAKAQTTKTVTRVARATLRQREVSTSITGTGRNHARALLRKRRRARTTLSMMGTTALKTPPVQTTQVPTQTAGTSPGRRERRLLRPHRPPPWRTARTTRTAVHTVRLSIICLS